MANIGSLFGDKSLHNALTRVDTLIDSLPKSNPSPPSKDITSSAIKEVLSAVEDTQSGEASHIESLLNQLALPFERQNRYKVYDDIHSSVQLIKSILGVYKNSILQKDAVDTAIITFNNKEEGKVDNTDFEQKKEFCKNAIEFYDLEKHLTDRIVPDILKYGDHFIEIIDLLQDVVDLPDSRISPLATTPNYVTEQKEYKPKKSYLTESYISIIENKYKEIPNNINGNKYNKAAQETLYEELLEKLVEPLIEIENINSNQPDIVEGLSYIQENSLEFDEIDIANKNLFKRFLLRFHEPKNIVALQTTYKTTIGFVEIKEQINPEITGGVAIRFAQMLSQISAGIGTQTQRDDLVSQKLVNFIINKIVRETNLVKDYGNPNFKERNREYEESLRNKLGDELFYFIKRLFFEVNPQRDPKNVLRRLKVRFIPTNKMIACPNNVNEYAPYGTSILDPLVYPGKLYLLTQMANVVMKVSRAAITRKWTLEVGPREQHTDSIQKLKRELRNQRITADNLMSFKSIPRIMSDKKYSLLSDHIVIYVKTKFSKSVNGNCQDCRYRVQ